MICAITDVLNTEETVDQGTRVGLGRRGPESLIESDPACQSRAGEQVFFLYPGGVSTLIRPHLKLLLFPAPNSHIHTWFLPFKLFFPCVSSKRVASKAQHSPLSRSDRTGRSSALSSPALDAISLLMLPWCPTALGHIKLQPVEALS